MSKYSVENLQVTLQGESFAVVDPTNIVPDDTGTGEREISTAMSFDLSSPRSLESFLRLFLPTIVAAGADLNQYLPPAQQSESHD